MIKSEVKAQFFGLPTYLLKSILKVLNKKGITPIKVNTFYSKSNIVKVKFGFPEIISKFEPKYVSKSIKKIELKIKNRVYSNEREILKINDVLVLSDEGLVISNDEILLDNYYGNVLNEKGRLRKIGFFSIKFHVQFMLSKIFMPKKTITVEKAFVITTRWSSNYFHWMTDVIPKIGILDNNYEGYSNIVINKIKYDFQYDSLKYFEHKYNFIQANQATGILVKQALIPVNAGAGYQNIKYVNSIYKKIVDDLNSFSRIFISRENARKRKLKNQNELDILLNNYGFNKIILENFKFEDQVRIFGQAEIVIAPHGAGITNIIFSNENIDLIELVPGYKTKNYLMYSEIAAFKKINYYLVVDNSRKKNFSKKSFKANILELEKILKKLINI
jgi:capsular polysaccharide biosynthesis protein